MLLIACNISVNSSLEPFDRSITKSLAKRVRVIVLTMEGRGVVKRNRGGGGEWGAGGEYGLVGSFDLIVLL